MRFDAYTVGAEPLCAIVPAPRKRSWFTEAAYSCTPMALANEAGWWLLNPRSFIVAWDGTQGTPALSFDGYYPLGSSHFGMGIVTFHVGTIFRTEPGWSLLVQGPVNLPKDGIAPLQGLIETDTAPETFTMNWKFTRPGSVTFEAGEPFAQITPVPTELVDGFEPRLLPLSADPEIEAAYSQWNTARSRTNQKYAQGGGKRQRNYIKHLAKRLYSPKPFDPAEPAETSVP